MSYKLILNQNPSYLHAIITGNNSKENVTRYLDEIRLECLARGCFRLLIEERLDGPRLGMLDVFDIAADASSNAIGIFKSIAYVDEGIDSEIMKFAEDVAVNRGIPVRMFLSVAEASEWLSNHEISSPG